MDMKRTFAWGKDGVNFEICGCNRKRLRQV